MRLARQVGSTRFRLVVPTRLSRRRAGIALALALLAAGEEAQAQDEPGLAPQGQEQRPQAELEPVLRGESERAVGGKEAAELSLQIRARQRLIAHQRRVDVVADGLIRALPPESRPDSVPYLGLRVAAQDSKESELLARAVGLSEPARPFVYSVDSAGPAAQAGMQPGDQVVGIAGERIKDAKRFYKLATRSDLEFPLRIEAFRDGRRLTFELQEAFRPRGFEVVVRSDAKKIYAYATKRELVITTAMLNFLANDSELAVILGHEIAHVVRGHFSSSYFEAGFQPYFSQGLENEADAYGLELAHRAGYDPRVAASLWERFETELPRQIADQWLLSHPPNRQRIASVRRIAERLLGDSAGPETGPDENGGGSAVP